MALDLLYNWRVLLPHQALSLWSWSTDSKTLDCQKTNPSGYQTVRTHTKENTGIQDLALPSLQQHPKIQTQSSVDRITPYSALPIRGKTNKRKLSTNLTLYDAYTNHWTKIRRAETKRKKEINLEAWGKETSYKIS